jgi:2-oxoglutarate dehydrogenase E2 component (dihydrolipoamide succinyltransferase)
VKVESKLAPKPAAAAAPVAAKPVGDRSETRVKMTRMRQRIAQRLKEAQNTAAMLTTFQETDMGNLMELRNKYKDDFEKVHGVKLGFMSAFVKVRYSTVEFQGRQYQGYSCLSLTSFTTKRRLPLLPCRRFQL